MSALVPPSTMDAGPYILGISWSLVGLSALFLILRLYVKWTRHRGLWWDDHVVVASWIMMFCNVAILTYGVSLGFGQHITEISTITATNLQFLVYLASVFSLLGAAWSKTSFALTLIRITEGSLRTAIWVVIASINMVLAANAVLPFLRCSPVERNWDLLMVEGECWDADISLSFSMFAAAFSGAMDVLLVLVPWVVITKTQMNSKEKLGVATCMSLGLLAGATAFIRCSKIPLLAKPDLSFEDGHLAIWTITEITTTIVAASIPVLRVFYRDIRPSYGRRKSYIMSTFDGTFPSASNIKHGLSRTATIITSANRKCRNGKNKPQQFCPEAAEFGSDSDGKIVQVQTVTVDYDVQSLRSSRLGLGPKPGQTAGFDVDALPPRAKLPEP
ncbi:hypothetical protein PG994_007124 [Apiospora phragmitis]|uniref:Rhodopsin domain-containing protein n=1 Tax=Apiospora phragmitis TaxID=2905665 RepID=A0ABR1UZV9_9PEZI